MELNDTLRFAKAWASLGEAITSQIEDLLAGRGHVTAGAHRYVEDRLLGISEEFDEAYLFALEAAELEG